MNQSIRIAPLRAGMHGLAGCLANQPELRSARSFKRQFLAIGQYHHLNSHGVGAVARAMPGRRNLIPRLDGHSVPVFADKHLWTGVFPAPFDVFPKCRSQQCRGTNESGAFLNFNDLNLAPDLRNYELRKRKYAV